MGMRERSFFFGGHCVPGPPLSWWGVGADFEAAGGEREERAAGIREDEEYE
jgi:hypothetical protein